MGGLPDLTSLSARARKRWAALMSVIALLVFLFLRSAWRLRRVSLPLGEAPLGTRVNAHQHRVYRVSGFPLLAQLDF